MSDHLSAEAERLMNAYARALRRYLAAEKALTEAAEPIAIDLVLTLERVSNSRWVPVERAV